MPRYVAFLRGISPMNAKMSELKQCFEAAGFTNVRTVLGSGNVVFDTRSTSEPAIEKKAEDAMRKALGHSFYTIVRSTESLRQLLASDPFPAHGVPAHAKRVVSFLRDAREPKVPLPHAMDDASVLCLQGREVFSAYLPSDKGPVFMRLIEKAFDRDVTTRTWETVAKCAAA